MSLAPSGELDRCVMSRSITSEYLVRHGATMEWYREGGPTMLLVLLVGVAGLVILIERFYVIVLRSKNNARVFIESVIHLVHAGKIDEAIKQCSASPAALSDIGLLILRSRSRNEADLQRVAGAAALAVLPKLTHRLQYLVTLAVVALLIGVVGTLSGVHRALLVDAAFAHGLAWALAPTIFALGVSAVLVLGRGYLLGQAETITEHIHEFSARLINALIDQPDVRLGHR
jgi:biopolymer transport protein ExbB